MADAGLVPREVISIKPFVAYAITDSGGTASAGWKP
jgi:hypothetical protein